MYQTVLLNKYLYKPNLGLLQTSSKIVFFTFFLDNVPSVSGSFEEHDFLVWAWNLSNVRRSNVRMSDLQKNRRKKNSPLLENILFEII